MEEKKTKTDWEKRFDFGFPFGRTTIMGILEKYALHIKKPFSEIFEFYTATYVEGAIKSFISQELKREREGLIKKIMDKYYYSEVDFTDEFWRWLNSLLEEEK